MTIPKVWAVVIGVVLALAAALSGYELLQEHDARLKAEGVQATQEQVIKANQATIDKVKNDQAQTAADLNQQLAAIAAERKVVPTPQQFVVDVSKLMPNLPQPVQVQPVAATPTAAATENIIIPKADIPAFQAYKLACDESSARLMACTKDAIGKDAIQEATASDLKAMTKDRDSWKATAKGGTFWQRFRHDAIVITVTAASAYAAGRIQHK